MQLQFERQHAFEVSLEQILVEVENGTDCEKEEKERKAERQRRKRLKRKLGKTQRTKKSHPLVGRKSGTRGWDKKTINAKRFYASQMTVRFCKFSTRWTN